MFSPIMKKVIKFHIPTANVLSKIEILKEKKTNLAVNESILCLKRRRPIIDKDKNPRKQKS